MSTKTCDRRLASEVGFVLADIDCCGSGPSWSRVSNKLLQRDLHVTHGHKPRPGA